MTDSEHWARKKAELTDPRDTRIAELEKEVARYRKFSLCGRCAAPWDAVLSERRSMPTLCNECFAQQEAESSKLKYWAEDPTPPAPVAQEPSRCICTIPAGRPHESGCPHYREAPKPPEVEEPAIVQESRLRELLELGVKDEGEDMGRSTLTDEEQRELIRGYRSFIDSRKAAVSELRSELADAKADVDTAMCNQDEALQRTYRLEEELSALKARPVVDVAKPLRELADYFREMDHVETTQAVANAWSHAREMCEVAIQDLGKEQPASAKADEKPAPMPSAEPDHSLKCARESLNQRAYEGAAMHMLDYLFRLDARLTSSPPTAHPEPPRESSVASPAKPERP